MKINGERHYLWRAVDYEGEVLESYVTKKRDKKAALKFMKKVMRRYGSPNEIVTDKLGPTAQQPENRAVNKQVTKRWANNRVENSHLPFRRREGPYFDFDECTVYRSSPPSMPRFTIYSTRIGHSQNAVHSNLTLTQLSPSGVL